MQEVYRPWPTKPFGRSSVSQLGMGAFGLALLMATVLLPGRAPAEVVPHGQSAAEVEVKAPTEVPDLADMIPEAVKLSGRLLDLERELKDLVDVSTLEKTYTTIETDMKGYSVQFQQVVGMKDYKTASLVQIRQAIRQENLKLESISKTLSGDIRKLANWREEWLTAQKRWDEWQSFLSKDNGLGSVKSVSAMASGTIDEALAVLSPKLEAFLALQARIGDSQAEAGTLYANINDLVLAQRRGAQLNDAPLMFSRHYFFQFTSEVWLAVKSGLHSVAWPNGRFFSIHGWIVFLHGVLSLLTIAAVYRKRTVLSNTAHWRLLAQRPVSAGLFIGTAIAVPFYEYWGVTPSWELIYLIILGISFARLSGAWIVALWKRRFIDGLLTIFIINILFSVINLPLPLSRLFTFFSALVGVYFCWRWAAQSRSNKEPPWFAWALRSGAIFLVFIILSELWGKHGKAQYLLGSLLQSLAAAFAFMFFAHIIHGSLEWLFRSSALRQVAILHTHAESIIRRVRFLVNIAIGFLLLGLVLTIWRIYPSLQNALEGFLALGFTLGSQRISIGLVIASAAILYGSFLLSWILQKTVVEEMLSRRRVELGARVSIERLVHYAIMVIGFLWAISALGLEITKLTIILGALGVGIGFGLQGIVNNFVSGLIMLFERPVRVGDWIELGGQWSIIKKIGLRATTIQTFDQAEVVIPNSDLVTNPVTNWTLSNTQARIIIAVGVAYGSDVPLVVETLMACANTNDKVAKIPEPEALFMRFGESSLDYELRAYLGDVRDRLQVISELNQEIDRRFREANIEIAFPQRDLHLRSLDESVTSRFRKITEEPSN